MCLYVLYKTCAGVNIDPMGQTLKKNQHLVDLNRSFNRFYIEKGQFYQK